MKLLNLMVRAFEIISMTIGFLSAAFALVNGSILTDDTSFDKEKSIELAKTVRIEPTSHTMEEKILADNLLGDYKNAEIKYYSTHLDPCYDIVIAPTYYNLNQPKKVIQIFENDFDYDQCDSFFSEDEISSIKQYGKKITNLIKNDVNDVEIQKNDVSDKPTSVLPYYYELSFSNHDNYPRMKLQSFITNFISYFHFVIGGIFGGGIVIIIFVIRHIREDRSEFDSNSIIKSS